MREKSTVVIVLNILISGLEVSLGSAIPHTPLPRPEFENGTIVGYDDPQVHEASGLAASKRHRNVLYTMNDSGGLPSVYAMNASSGALLARIDIAGATNCDWEDISVGPGPGGESYIYVGDTGGNSKRVCLDVYRVPEPDEIIDMSLEYDAVLRFSWNEPNCETLLVDESGHVYLVSKVMPGITPRIYRLPESAWNSGSRVTLDNGQEANIHHPTEGPVGGDISANGREILIKTYNIIYYWSRSLDQAVEDVLQTEPVILPYIVERQGEAICWDREGSGYFTLSEHTNQPLYYYARKHNVHVRTDGYSSSDKERSSLCLVMGAFLLRELGSRVYF